MNNKAFNVAFVSKIDIVKMPPSSNTRSGDIIMFIISIIQMPLRRRNATHAHTTNSLMPTAFHS